MLASGICIDEKQLANTGLFVWKNMHAHAHKSELLSSPVTPHDLVFLAEVPC